MSINLDGMGNATLPQSTARLLIRQSINGTPVDLAITYADLTKNLLTTSLLGNGVGQVPVLVPSSLGSGTALPAISGENLTNLAQSINTATSLVNGVVKLSDDYENDSRGAANGVAISPLGVKTFWDRFQSYLNNLAPMHGDTYYTGNKSWDSSSIYFDVLNYEIDFSGAVGNGFLKLTQGGLKVDGLTIFGDLTPETSNEYLASVSFRHLAAFQQPIGLRDLGGSSSNNGLLMNQGGSLNWAGTTISKSKGEVAYQNTIQDPFAVGGAPIELFYVRTGNVGVEHLEDVTVAMESYGSPTLTFFRLVGSQRYFKSEVVPIGSVWRNVSGILVNHNQSGLFVRIS